MSIRGNGLQSGPDLGQRCHHGLDAGAEALGRRGEDPRFEESRPAAQRRRDIDAAMPERAETETRADVARRLDSGRTGPMSYEIGGPDDPDWADKDPGTS